MRKVEKEMIQAIKAGKSRTLGNTRVDVAGDVVAVYLHGNKICEMGKDAVALSLAGWNTLTTKSRVNALCHAFTDSRGVYTSKGVVYGFGEAWPIGVAQWYTFPRV